MLIAGITAGYICLERHRPVEGILLLAGIAGSFAAISEQMGKEYGMTRKQLRVMLLLCARHGTSLTGESPVTGIYRQV